MTLPDPDTGRKPRRRRGPMGPILFLLLLAAIYTGGWYWLKAQTELRMDATAKQLGDQGYQLTWGSRAISGYPFRLDVTLTDVRVSEPSGWALTTPAVKGEAYIYALKHWVLVTPQGLTFTRPDGGAVIVQAKALRASLADVDKKPPRIALEGFEMTFSPEAGAKPYFLSAAKQLNFRLIPGPNDLGGVLLHVTGARMALEGIAARAVENGEVDMDADLTLTRMSQFTGDSWADAARDWTRAGGVIEVRRVAVTGGQALLETTGGTLKADDNGRLEGDLTVRLGDLTGTGQSLLKGTGSLRDGQARFGPLVIGPAPRLY